MTISTEDHLNRVPELDTLRAWAISLVLLFHLDVTGFEFGYLGVDLFFVLSGYLMTKIVMKKYTNSGQFDVISFLIKRFWRLAPSFVIVTAMTLVFCTLLFSPDALRGVGAQIKYSLLIISNHFFFDQAGYFAPENELRPFLHTWSLSVEEQFYLLFALLLFLSRWIRFQFLISLVFIVGLILWLGLIWQINTSQLLLTKFPVWPSLEKSEEAIFYLMPFRLFQFAGGSLFALAMQNLNFDQVKGSKSVFIVAFSVALTVLAVKFNLNNYSSAIVTFAAILLIIPNKLTAEIGHFYLTKFLAKISYQLYLVHWPIIVLWRYLTLDELSYIESISLGGASIICGWLLWILTKRLTFHSISQYSHKRVIKNGAVVILGAVTCLVLAVGTQKSHGLKWRVPKDRIIKSSKEMRTEESAFCEIMNQDGRKLVEKIENQFVTCRANSGAGEKIFVFGDSHARHLVAGLAKHFPDNEINILYRSSCHAQSGINNYVYDYENRKSLANDCIARNKNALQYFENVAQTSTIIIHQYAGYGTDKTENFMMASEELIKRLGNAGHKIIWIGPVIRPGKLVADCAAMPYSFPSYFLDRRCSGNKTIAQDIFNYSTDLHHRFPGVFLNISKFFCPETQVELSCRMMTKDNKALFRDKHHLTVDGSIELISFLIQEHKLRIEN